MLINSPSTRGGGLGFAYVSQGGGVSWNAYFCLLRGGRGLKTPQNGLLNKRMVPKRRQCPFEIGRVSHAVAMVHVTCDVRSGLFYTDRQRNCDFMRKTFYDDDDIKIFLMILI